MADSGSSRGLLRAELGELFWVAVGAVPGALLRWQLGLQLVDRNVLVNVCGAALLGWLAGAYGIKTSTLLGVGFCGSLTTFSSWMLDAAKLFGAGAVAEAFGLLGLTLGLGFGAATAGWWLSRARQSQRRVKMGARVS